MPDKADTELFSRDPAALEAWLESWVGENMSGGVSDADDPVNMPMIRRWVDAFEDRNPVYEDEARASASRFGGLIAPPAMMQTWIMPRPIDLTGIAERGGEAQVLNAEIPHTVLHNSGYTGVLATNSRLEFDRPLRHGELLRTETIYKSTSPRKKTRLGVGYFLTWTSHYYVDNNEEVGRQTFTLFKFNPTAEA